MPPSLKSFSKDLERNFKNILQKLLSKFDLVIREEFEI
ncbi:accessory factor UbiK family protein [Coxiella endosymbiont of Rhipicephalus microplus]|nr:accessory factor UbiK family protein [Coxiella endosymbiont of Rhipicephalus microplus]